MSPATPAAQSGARPEPANERRRVHLLDRQEELQQDLATPGLDSVERDRLRQELQLTKLQLAGH